MLVKPAWFCKLSIKNLMVQKKLFKGTNLEKLTNYNIEYTQSNKSLHENVFRFMGVLFMLIAFIGFNS